MVRYKQPILSDSISHNIPLTINVSLLNVSPINIPYTDCVIKLTAQVKRRRIYMRKQVKNIGYHLSLWRLVLAKIELGNLSSIFKVD